MTRNVQVISARSLKPQSLYETRGGSVHRLTVVTRNVADFRSFGVQLFNPFVE